MLICFDLDDTLLDHSGAEKAAALHFGGVIGERSVISGEAFVRAWRRAAERHMATFLRGEVSFQEQRRRRIRELITADTDGEADTLFEIYLEAYRANWRLFDDVTECLVALGAYQLGVISNGSRAQQLEKLKTLRVAQCFSFVLTAEEAKCAKPDPAIFRRAEAFAKRFQPLVYIGDNLKLDAEAAARAGWHGVWLNRGSTGTPSDLPSLTTLRELPALIRLL